MKRDFLRIGGPSNDFTGSPNHHRALTLQLTTNPVKCSTNLASKLLKDERLNCVRMKLELESRSQSLQDLDLVGPPGPSFRQALDVKIS